MSQTIIALAANDTLKETLAVTTTIGRQQRLIQIIISLGTLMMGQGGTAASLAVKQIAGGCAHVCALLTDNRIKCVGENFFGQLGLENATYRGDQAGDLGDRLPHVDLGENWQISQLIANGGSNCAILTDPQTHRGRAKCWGGNLQGKLGFAASDNYQDLRARWGDAPGEMGKNLPFLPIPTEENITDIGLSEAALCVISDHRKMRCTSQVSGESNLLTTIKPIDLGAGIAQFAMSVGENACVLFTDGKMKCWGHNADGELGYGKDIRSVSAKDIQRTPFVATAAPVRKIALGAARACALLVDNTVQCWGFNHSSTLGVGTEDTNVYVPQAKVDLGDFGEIKDIANFAHRGTCVLSTQGRVKCWGVVLGYGDTNTRGAPETMGNNLPFMDFGFPVTSLGQSCVILSNGGAKCWGKNLYGQLGIGDTEDRGDDADEMGLRLPFMYLWD